MNKPKKDARGGQKGHTYIFKLYVADNEPNSQMAKKNLKSICEEYLKDRYEMQEVDALTDFNAALKDSVFVTPTLVLVAPAPRATIIGNLTHKDAVISALRLRK
jgi:circadian clock protein KaiB